MTAGSKEATSTTAALTRAHMRGGDNVTGAARGSGGPTEVGQQHGDSVASIGESAALGRADAAPDFGQFERAAHGQAPQGSINGQRPARRFQARAREFDSTAAFDTGHVYRGQLGQPRCAHPVGRTGAGRAGPLMGMHGSAGEGGVDDSHSFPEQFLRRRSVSKDPTFHSDSHVNSDSARGPAGTLGSDATTPLADATGGPAGGPTTLTTYGGGNTALTARPPSSPSRVEFAVGQLATAAITQPHTFFRMPLPLHLCNCVSVCLCVSE